MIANVYAPNDHDVGFFRYVYEKILKYKNEHQEVNIIIGGDFNLVMGNVDSVNRGANAAELASRTFLQQQNDTLDLVDSCRQVNQSGGFTWSRRNCLSKLDMVFVAREQCDQNTEANINWGFDRSDHANITIQVKIKQQ